MVYTGIQHTPGQKVRAASIYSGPRTVYTGHALGPKYILPRVLDPKPYLYGPFVSLEVHAESATIRERKTLYCDNLEPWSFMRLSKYLKLDYSHAYRMTGGGPPPCNSGILAIYEDPNIVLIMPYPRYRGCPPEECH